MFDFIGKLFGTDAATSKLIDSASSGIDKMFYTEEEKAEAMAADRSAARSMVIEWMRNTQGQNLARRLLALMIAGVWLAQYSASMLLNMLAPWQEPAVADKIAASAKVLTDAAGQMDGAMMLLLGFYFAAPHMGSIATVALAKFGAGRKDTKVAPKKEGE